MPRSFLSRRAFLQTTAAAAAGATLVSQSVSSDAEPSYALPNNSSANDRIRFGIVGVGMEGSGVLATAVSLPGTECVAAADLYDGRHILAREIAGNAIKTTRRYQELLDDKSIDAILIAVPDHWHKQVVVDSLAAGKDVYCEKPMSHSAAEGVAMLEAAQKSGRIVQIGSQRVSSQICARAREMIAQGAIGDLMKGVPKTVLSGILGVLGKKDKDALSSGQISYKPGAGVAQWASVILKALSLLGQSSGWLGTVERRMNQESGGNPSVVNRWDSNWKAGTPSVGLMQVIGPTFKRWAGPFVDTGPQLYGVSVDPRANIFAGLNYAEHRYPTLQYAMDKPGGYKDGGLATRTRSAVLGSYARGTDYVPMDGLYQLHRGEAVTSAAQNTGNGPVVLEVRSDGSKFSDLVVESINKADSTGRIRVVRR